MSRFLVGAQLLLVVAAIAGCSGKTETSSEKDGREKDVQAKNQASRDADKKQPGGKLEGQANATAAKDEKPSRGSQANVSAASSPVKPVDLAYLPDGYSAAVVLNPTRILAHPAIAPEMRHEIAIALTSAVDDILPVSEILPDLDSLEQVVLMANARLLEGLLNASTRSGIDELEDTKEPAREYSSERLEDGEFEEKGSRRFESKDSDDFPSEKGDFKGDFNGKSIRIEEDDVPAEKEEKGIRVDDAKEIDLPELDLPQVPDFPELPDLEFPDPDAQPDARDSSLSPEHEQLLIPGSYVAFIEAAEDDIVQQLVDRAHASGMEWDRASQSVNALRKILLGIHNYHDANRQFPRAYSVDKDGKPLLSWRVHLLPYIEEQVLYDRFHLDEPWNSENNKNLIEQMPAVYNSPGAKNTSGLTRYLAVRGKNSVLSDTNRRGFFSITDGSSNTVAFVEADERVAVTWTKPQDYEVEKADYPEDLFGKRDSFLAAFVDGHVEAIAAPLEKASFLSLCDAADKLYPDYNTKQIQLIEGQSPGFVLVLRYRERVDTEKEVQRLLGRDHLESHDIHGNTYYTSRDAWRGCLAIDKRTLLLTLTAHLPRIVDADPDSDDPLKNELRSISRDNDFIAALVVPEHLPEQAGALTETLGKNLPAQFQDVAKLPAALEAATLQVNLSGDTLAKLQVRLNDEELASRLTTTAKRGVDLAKTSLGLIENRQPTTPTGELAFSVADDVLKNVSVEQSDSLLSLTVIAPDQLNERVAKLMLESRKSGEESVEFNNLKQIGFGFHNHFDVFRLLPPAKRDEWYDKEGNPLLSWRVHILFLIEENNLYEQFKLDEPWDSEHNIKLLDQMPEVYRTTDSPTKTTLMMVVGEGTAYEGKTGLSFGDFSDGVSNTILVVRAGADQAVPWTKPDDLAFDPKDPVAVFGNLDGDSITVLMTDGSVHRLPKNIKPETLRALLTRNGGEDVTIPEADAPMDEKAEARVGDTTKHHVQGKVTLDGKPLTRGLIVLASDDSEIRGNIAPDGTYDLPSVPAGIYTVHFQASDPDADSFPLPPQYLSNETTGLKIDVRSDSEFDFSLASK